MNIQTLKNLSKNPHYKLSDKQKRQLAEYDRKPMIEFGVMNKHNNKMPIHSTGQTKRKKK